MEIIRKKNKSRETKTLVEQRNALSRPGTLRRRYDPHSQRTIFAPSRPNNHSREQIAEIDAKLLQTANRLRAATNRSKMRERRPKTRKKEKFKTEQKETKEDSVILRGDNLSIVDWSKFKTQGKEANYIQINHIVGILSGNKEITEETIKRAEFEFMLELKSPISRTAIDPELTRVTKHVT